VLARYKESRTTVQQFKQLGRCWRPVELLSNYVMDASFRLEPSASALLLLPPCSPHFSREFRCSQSLFLFKFWDRTSAPVDPTAPTFHPVSSRYPPSELFGELEPSDTEWTCAGGFVTETQIFYNILEDGTSVMCQVIHSAIGYV